MSAEATVNALITSQNAAAQLALNSAKYYSDQAQTAAISYTSLTDPDPVVAEEVNINMPVDYDPAGEFTSAYNGAFADYGPQFSSLFSDFLDDFFPEVDGCVRLLTDQWICNTIEFGGTGIPADIERQIWDRARSREEEQVEKAADDAANEWAGRGFSIPPGALVGAVNKARSDANSKISTLSRDTAIKNIEIEIENIRFAVEQGVKLRLGAIQSAVDYVKAWFLVPQTAIDKARALTETRYKFYANTAAYYNAIISAAELQLKADIHNAEMRTRNNTNFVDLVTRNSQARVSAAVGSAEAMGKAAAAALGALNTLANLGNVTTINQ